MVKRLKYSGSYFGAAGVLFGLLTLVSCGVYTFNPAGKSSIKSIAIERFENKTPEFGLADEMTDLVIDAFIADGSMRVVAVQNAEAVLTGVLSSYSRRPYDYDENDVVSSYAITMGFEIALSDAQNGAELWKETMSQQGTYQVDVETEENARQRAVKLLVEAIINKTTRSW